MRGLASVDRRSIHPGVRIEGTGVTTKLELWDYWHPDPVTPIEGHDAATASFGPTSTLMVPKTGAYQDS